MTACLTSLSALMCAQETPKPVQICIVSTFSSSGRGIQTAVNNAPERDVLVAKLTSTAIKTSSGEVQIEALTDTKEPTACAQEKHGNCDYMLAVSPITVSRSSYLPPTPLPSSSQDPQPLPSQGAQFAQDHQLEPTDHAEMAYFLLRAGDCHRLLAKIVAIVQTDDGPPSQASIETLTAQVAERVRKAIAKDRRP